MSKIYSKSSLILVVFLFLLSFFKTAAQEVVFRINTGGITSDYNGEQFITDNYFDTGTTLDRPQTGLPEPYQSFRFSRSQQMGYDIPVPDGEYVVNLYFAELWFGATGGGSGGVGSRVFDVTIEGQLAEDNLDVFAEVGADAMLMKSHLVTVTGGVLNIDFDSRDVVGGERHPIINAIEILSNNVQTSVININPIANQLNEINDTVTLGVVASGGDPNVAFTYDILNQPSGISINETTGLISGVIDPSAITGGANNDGVHQVTVVVSKPGSEDASETFDWSISHASCTWNSLSDANIKRYEAVSQKIGDKLYVLGGFKPGILVVAEPEIYDTTNDIWTLGALMPVPVTHTAAVAIGSDIWIIGGFAGDNPGVATNVVQIYNTLTDSWSFGPALPDPVGSGAAALNGTKIYFVGGLEPDRQTNVADHLVLDLQNIAAGWTLAAPMPNPRNHHSYISLNGLIYAIGGQYGHDGPKQDTKLVHAYNPISDEWTQMADLARPRSHFKSATTIHNGKIIIVGGIDDGPIVNDISVYDPQLNLWSLLCKLDGEGLDAPSAQVFGDRLIVSGGRPIRDSNIMLRETKWLQLEPSTSQPPLADTGQDQSITLPTSSVTINGSGSDPDGGTVTFLWSQESGPSTAGLSGASTSELTASNLVVGDYVFRLTVTDDESETAFDEVTITVNNEIIAPDFALRINTGGIATNYEGEDFIADQYANTGNTLDRPQTGLPEPYQSFRYSRSQQMGYDIPVPDGEYTVNLYFAELWFGATGGGSGGVGSRVFDVTIEGQLAEDNLDIFAEVGADVMLVKTHTVTVIGGVLDIDFDSRDVVGGERHPVINAIEILGRTAPQESRPFVTTWKTDNPGASEDNQITIPTYLGETYNYSVDWGDGTSDSGITGDIIHTYNTSGTYQVSISGDFPRIYFGYEDLTNNNLDEKKLLYVNQWGDIQWSSMESAFQFCENLDVLAVDTPDLSNVSNVQGMFYICSSLVGNNSFDSWEVSNVTNFVAMFRETSFNQPLSNWNVSNAATMGLMFGGASEFNQPIGNWDVSSVTNMSNMFEGANSFNQDIGGWNVANVNSMFAMFNNASAFNQDLGNWNVSNVTDMQGMFVRVGDFNHDISGWDVSKVTNMAEMFIEAASFNQDIGGWNVSNVTNMYGMFGSATAFDQDLGLWNISNVTQMHGIFEGVTLSTENYDSLLNGWSTQQLQNGVTFHGGNSAYCLGEAARQVLIDDFGWIISDGGKALDCPDPNAFALRINTGGLAVDYNDETFVTDNYFNTGRTLDRPQTGLPEPYQTFRYSRSQLMGYDIPVPDGEYIVNLYFAELWFGATGGGSGGVGNRIFDISIEGLLAEDNLDIFAEVGADAMLMKTYTVNVSGGVLDIDFNSTDAVGGERHPIINAIEILGVSSDNLSSNSLRSTILKSFILSPNPVATTTTLSFEKPVQLTEILVFDITGRLVHTYNGEEVVDDGAYLLNVDVLPAGTYFIKSQGAKGEQYQKQMVIKK